MRIIIEWGIYDVFAPFGLDLVPVHSWFGCGPLWLVMIVMVVVIVVVVMVVMSVGPTVSTGQ